MATDGDLMEIVKVTEKYTIVKKRSGRYGVRSKSRNWIRGQEKVDILVQAGLLTASAAKAEKESASGTAAAGEEAEAR